MFGNRLVNYGGPGGIRRGLIWQSGGGDEYKEYYVIPLADLLEKGLPYAYLVSVLFQDAEHQDVKYEWKNTSTQDLAQRFLYEQNYQPNPYETRIVTGFRPSAGWVPMLADADRLVFMRYLRGGYWPKLYDYDGYWRAGFPTLIVPTERLPQIGRADFMALYWRGTDWSSIGSPPFQYVVNDDYTSRDGEGVFRATDSHIFPGRSTRYFKAGTVYLYGSGGPTYSTMSTPFDATDVPVKVFKDALVFVSDWVPGYDCYMRFRHVIVPTAILPQIQPIP